MGLPWPTDGSKMAPGAERATQRKNQKQSVMFTEEDERRWIPVTGGQRDE